MNKAFSIPSFIWLFLIPFFSFGQDRFAVHYKFKPQTSFGFEAPEKFLLQKALDRRIKEGVEIDSTDLPVSDKYVDWISPMVEKIHYHSKWMNASVVVATGEQMTKVAALPFIEKVELVAKGFHPTGPTGKKESQKIPIKLKSFLKKSNTYDFQNDILGIPAMHGEGFTGEGVMIAVFDAGFENADQISGMKHLFEQDKIVATKDFVFSDSDYVYRSDGHGTASLSLMASYEDSILISGAYQAQYILCITEDVSSEYRIEEYNWIRAAEFSDSLGVDIINSSLGYNFFDDPEMNYSKEDMDGRTALITIGATIAAEKGILVISSAGNEGNGDWQTLTAPADAGGIIAVGSVTNSFNRSSFSSIGPTFDGRLKPDLVAFGSGVTIWRRVDGPHTSSGTSFTSPQIAALAAGLWQARPEWTKEQIIHNLLNSGNMADDPNNEVGYGIPNFMDAFYGEIFDFEEQEELYLGVLYPNPLDGNHLYIEYGRGKQCSFRMINSLGQIISDQNLKRISPWLPYEVRLDNANPGLYFIECQENNHTQRFRFLKR